MNEFLDFTLLHVGKYTLKVSAVISVIVFAFLVILLLKIIKKAVYRTKHLEPSRQYSIYGLIKYAILLLSVAIGLQLLGFNLSILIAGSAALLVGLGLGIQNLFSDFISGIIILMDSSVKVNDIIEVNGLVCQVEEINFRTTMVLTRDDKYIILPNTTLTKNQLINWTHSDVASRFEINVGVDYSSDVKLVMQILKEVAEQHEHVLKKPAPFVRFIDFGDSSLQFSVIFWAEEVFRVENIKSEMRVKIFELFKKNNITIPFPQRVIHMDK